MLLILTADNIDVFPAFPPNTLAPVAQLLDRTPNLHPSNLSKPHPAL